MWRSKKLTSPFDGQGVELEAPKLKVASTFADDAPSLDNNNSSPQPPSIVISEMASTATARDTLCAFCEQKMSGLITTGKHSGKAWVAGRNVKIWETANTCPICHAISKSFLTTEDQASKNSVQIEVRDDRLRQSNAEPLPLIEFDIIAKELRGKALRILLVKGWSCFQSFPHEQTHAF